MRKCDCRAYKQNITTLNGIIDTYAKSKSGNPRGYIGRPFVYCPWCSKKLIESNENSKPNIKGRIIG
jgi:hypothetical protein